MHAPLRQGLRNFDLKQGERLESRNEVEPGEDGVQGASWDIGVSSQRHHRVVQLRYRETLGSDDRGACIIRRSFAAHIEDPVSPRH